MTVTLEIVEDPSRACAALLVSAAIGGGDIMLTGGSSPKVAYQEFVQAVQKVGMDTSRTTFWLGDERCVEEDDERSNYRMIKESLLDPLAGPTAPTMHRIKGELGPDLGAEDYERALEAGPSEMDLVLLGIGPDGHCASLFPGQDTLWERSRLVVGVPEAGLEPFVPRVSLTFTGLMASRQIVFLATGSSKADAVAEAFGPHSRPDPAVPSSLLAAEAKHITVLLDREAAARLDGAG
ncbi:MAG: 6-phosphogluconolactonase [Solirubrobacteraceae bacterium]